MKENLHPSISDLRGLSQLTLLKDLSCTLLIKLLDFPEENIQIGGQ